MGRAIVAIFFFVAVIIFWIIKAAMVGTKAAYEAVFDPSAPDRRVKAVLEGLSVRLELFMKQNDIGDRRTLRQLIAEMVPLTQSYVFDSGYKIPSDLAKTLAISAVVASGRASEREIQNAISGV